MATRQLYIVIMIYCVSDFKKSHATALDANGACSCSSGCNFTQSCIPTDNCRKENVALGKTARISSTYSDTQGPAGPACVAVNGNTGSKYVPDTQSRHPNCIHTAVNDHNAWWEVDLGRNYTITDITVYIWDSQPERMDGVIITVDGQDCYTFPSRTTSSPLQKQISCNTPRTGSLVKFSRNYLLNICEVQVWVCKDGFFGKNCTESCSSKCRNDLLCDNFYGTCLPEECSKGYYGINCSQVCGNCKDDSTCNSTNGQCFAGCKIGWKEPMCTECQEGNYGVLCNQTCGKCMNSMCNASNGVCPEGCQDGFEPPFCNETCRNHTYGQNCSVQCGRCNKSAQCDAITGNCASCEANFQLPKCIECIRGYYGEDCNIPCGHCKDGKMCNNTDGVCPDGCEDGYEFPLCNKKCSSGTWGRNCENACGACLRSTCRHDNGICEKGCFSGYEGEHCAVLLQQTNDRHLTGVIAGSVVGAGLLIGISIFIAVLIWLRRSTLKDKRCPQPSVEDKETHDTSKDDIAMENSNFYENAYDKLETREDVAKPYEMLGKETHVDDVMQSQH